MKVIYRYYEPDKGLEEIQAKIYNNELRRSPKSSSSEVTAEGIKQRFITEKKDPKNVRYALKEDGSPLAYIQVSVRGISPPRTWIGYPWAMDDCPVEVQEKLFSEMLEYSRDKYPDNEIVMGYISSNWQRQVSFAESKGFVVDDALSIYFYTLGINSVVRKNNQEFKVKIANLDDVDALVELCKADPNLENVFSDDEGWISFFRDSVLPGGHTILILKDNQLVCAGAPTKGTRKDAIQMRFFAIRPGFQKAWKTLMEEVVAHCKEEGWEESLLFAGFYKTELELVGETLEELGAKFIDKQVRWSLKNS
ncbi:MAG: hypothetical protein ACFFD4_21100 [Candidatus Odinarchaeota archaeon]